MAATALSAEDLSSLFTTIYCGNSALTILFFDWLLCLDQEVACVWNAAGGLNAGSLVYAFSRFPLIIGVVFNTVTIFPLSLWSCHLAVWAGNSAVLLSRFSIGMFSAFRVYAVSGRKVIPTLAVSLLSTVPIVISLVMYGGRFTKVEVLPSPLYCSNINTLSSQWTLRTTVISRTTLIAAEAIVVAITWRNRVCRIEMGRETLGSVLLRDGSLYFIILALLNVLQIILTAASLDAIDAKASYVTIFIDPISSILTCRFILNLRQVNHRRMLSTMVSSAGGVHFAVDGARSTLPRFVASFGEPLHTAPVGSEEGDDDVEDVLVGEDDGTSRAWGGADISA